MTERPVETKTKPPGLLTVAVALPTAQILPLESTFLECLHDSYGLCQRVVRVWDIFAHAL